MTARETIASAGSGVFGTERFGNSHLNQLQAWLRSKRFVLTYNSKCFEFLGNDLFLNNLSGSSITLP